MYVETVLKVHKKYSSVVATAFKNDSGFVEALDKACRRFINDNAVTKLAKVFFVSDIDTLTLNSDFIEIPRVGG